MDAFMSVLEKYELKDRNSFRRKELDTLQINMGNLCNQMCLHCHIDASPSGKNIMPKGIVDDILGFLSKYKIQTLDVTGGAPELNPDFDYFIINARPKVYNIIVRSNLTVFFELGMEYLPEFFKKYKIHLICSLPCYTEANVDAQRGKGVFKKSIEALKLLNELGYAKLQDLALDLVYNPLGAYLPVKQDELEKDYKLNLRKNYGVNFNSLITITNVPIKKFRNQLESFGGYDRYLKLLEDNFNPDTIENIMCKNFISVGYDGRLYDCDFNQALGWVMKDKGGNSISIDKLNPIELREREILLGEHCFSCTAGFGSSCQGTLVDAVKQYYGKVLKNTKDLKTSACCSMEAVPAIQKNILKRIHHEVTEKFYGCGSPIPPLLEGLSVLDLGCGTGKDVYTISALVGENGRVVGVDMTDEQLEVAKKHIDYHTKEFGYSKPNIEFKKGYIEDLKSLGIKDNSMDVVISNCVINLSNGKKEVFKEIFRVLKPGGELYFSDVFTGKRMPKDLVHDPLLYAECLAGALYIEDFRRVLREIGCLDYRVVSKRRIILNNPEIEAKAGMINFYSMTIRAFKLDDLEDICEDYGQSAVYLGSITDQPHRFELDDHHIFIAHKPMLICGNTASMLANTRYKKCFKLEGSRSIHFGQFNYAPASVKIERKESSSGGACC